MPGEEEAVEAPPECFVCTESVPAPRRSACRCVDRFVHDSCLSRMLERSQQAACPVCLEPYANVASQLRVVGVDVCSRGGMVLGGAVAATILFVCGMNTWWIYCCSQRNLSEGEEVVACFGSILMASVCFAAIAFVARECVFVGVKDLALSVVIRRRKTRVLPSAEVALPPRLAASEFELDEQRVQ